MEEKYSILHYILKDEQWVLVKEYNTTDTQFFDLYVKYFYTKHDTYDAIEMLNELDRNGFLNKFVCGEKDSLSFENGCYVIIPLTEISANTLNNKVRQLQIKCLEEVFEYFQNKAKKIYNDYLCSKSIPDSNAYRCIGYTVGEFEDLSERLQEFLEITEEMRCI